MKRFRLWIGLMLVAGMSTSIAPIEASVTASSQESSPPYVKGQFIVKFRSEGKHAVNACAHCLLAAGRDFRQATTDGSHLQGIRLDFVV